jgi:hypothetical protein
MKNPKRRREATTERERLRADLLAWVDSKNAVRVEINEFRLTSAPRIERKAQHKNHFGGSAVDVTSMHSHMPIPKGNNESTIVGCQ